MSIEDNALSILSIPDNQITFRDAIRDLYRRALFGEDCYAYQAAGQGAWNVWVNGTRYTVKEWEEEYDHGFGELG